MMKNVLFLFFCALSISLSAQTKLTQRKVPGTISAEYLSYTSPFKVRYTANVYAGSGNYTYKWREKGKPFGVTTSIPVLVKEYNCGAIDYSEAVLYCEVTDVTTKEKIVLKVRNPLGICTNAKIGINE